MNLEILRKLAKSDRFQAIYHRAKNSGMIKLFKNNYDLSRIQEWFLHYLEIYNLLYKDLVNGEKYISEEVIQNDIRTDAYLLLKSKSNPNQKTKKREITTSGDVPSVIFKRK